MRLRSLRAASHGWRLRQLELHSQDLQCSGSVERSETAWRETQRDMRAEIRKYSGKGEMYERHIDTGRIAFKVCQLQGNNRNLGRLCFPHWGCMLRWIERRNILAPCVTGVLNCKKQKQRDTSNSSGFHKIEIVTHPFRDH